MIRIYDDRGNDLKTDDLSTVAYFANSVLNETKNDSIFDWVYHDLQVEIDGSPQHKFDDLMWAMVFYFYHWHNGYGCLIWDAQPKGMDDHIFDSDGNALDDVPEEFEQIRDIYRLLEAGKYEEKVSLDLFKHPFRGSYYAN